MWRRRPTKRLEVACVVITETNRLMGCRATAQIDRPAAEVACCDWAVLVSRYPGVQRGYSAAALSQRCGLLPRDERQTLGSDRRRRRVDGRHRRRGRQDGGASFRDPG